MAAISSQNRLAIEICEALKLKNVIELELRMAVDEIVSIKVKYYPNKEDMEKLIPIFKKYELKEIE